MDKVMKVPSFRIPMLVGYLQPGQGGWYSRAAEYLRSDVFGNAYCAKDLALRSWTPSIGNAYTGSSVGYFRKLPEGKVAVTVYFLSAEKAAADVKYPLVTAELIAGRDGMVAIGIYQEYFVPSGALVFDEAGGPPRDVAKELVKEAPKTVRASKLNNVFGSTTGETLIAY